MANIQSQKKRNRQNEKRRVRNKSVRSEVRTAMRRVHEALGSDDAETAREAGRVAQHKLGVAARKGVLSKRTMARKQSRLARRVNRGVASPDS